jgi:hypothetical protein
MSVSMISHRTEQIYNRVVRGFKDIVSKMFSGVTQLTNCKQLKVGKLLSLFNHLRTLH